MLTKVYAHWLGLRKTLAVDTLNLAVKEGCTYGFLGPNGAGKTTTIKMLLGLINPTRGSGTVLGLPMGDKNAKEQIGFLPEEPAFGRHLKAREFLNLCAKLSHIPREKRSLRIGETLETVGLANRAGSRLREFSKGMLQRIGIAQALLHDPRLLILDEPMTGLDPPGRREVKEIMLRLTERGKTIFFSSHILSDVEEICDSVGILNHGHLILSGQLAELLDTGGVEMIVTDLPASLLEKIEPIVPDMSKHGNQWVFKLVDDQQKEKTKRILAENGFDDIQIRRDRRNLEELFMQTIKQNNQSIGKEMENG